MPSHPDIYVGPAGASGAGPVPITGAPDALIYIAPSGSGIITDPRLVAAPLDPYNRPQLRDTRLGTGGAANAVWRQGAWQADGDSENIVGDGIVIYAPIDAANGNFARIKGDRFGIRRIFSPTIDDYSWRVDNTEHYYKDDSNTKVFSVIRATGNGLVGGTWQIGGSTGATLRYGNVIPEGAIVGNPGDIYFNVAGGTGTAAWIKETGTGTNTGWSPIVTLAAAPHSIGSTFHTPDTLASFNTKISDAVLVGKDNPNTWTRVQIFQPSLLEEAIRCFAPAATGSTNAPVAIYARGGNAANGNAGAAISALGGNSVGNAAGAGLYAKGGTTSAPLPDGPGVIAEGGGAGAEGLRGIGGTGGPGAAFIAGTGGYGFTAQADTGPTPQRSAGRFTAQQQDPTSASLGDFYVRNDGRMRLCNGSQWESLLAALTGECFISTPAITPNTQQPAFTKVLGTYGIDAATLVGFTHNAGRLTYTNLVTRLFLISANITLTVSPTGDTIYFRIAKNGTTVAKSEQYRALSGTADVGQIGVNIILSLALNDYIEVFLSNAGAVSSTTVQRLTLTVNSVS